MMRGQNGIDACPSEPHLAAAEFARATRGAVNVGCTRSRAERWMVKAKMCSIPKPRTAASKVNGPDAERGTPGSKRWIILNPDWGYRIVGRHDTSDDEIR